MVTACDLWAASEFWCLEETNRIKGTNFLRESEGCMTNSGDHYFVFDSATEILGFELLQYFSFVLWTKKLRTAFSLGFLQVGINSIGFFLGSDLSSQPSLQSCLLQELCTEMWACSCGHCSGWGPWECPAQESSWGTAVLPECACKFESTGQASLHSGLPNAEAYNNTYLPHRSAVRLN